MGQPVGHSGYAHGLHRGSTFLWRHGDKATTVLTVKDSRRITVEGAPPFYRSSSGGADADFTHVVVEIYGFPFPLLFDGQTRFAEWSESFRDSD